MRNRWLLAMAALGLNGCVAVWGSSYTVKDENPSSVTIRYDTHFTSDENIEAHAQEHCALYRKNAFPQTKDKSIWGLTTASFACVQARLFDQPYIQETR